MKRICSLLLLTLLASNIYSINILQLKTRLPSKTTTIRASTFVLGLTMALLIPDNTLYCSKNYGTSAAFEGCRFFSDLGIGMWQLFGCSLTFFSAEAILTQILSAYHNKIKNRKRLSKAN